MWECDECGQESGEGSMECETCQHHRGVAGAPPAKSRTFEIDGKQVDYLPPQSKGDIGSQNKEIARRKKQAGL